MKLQYPVHEATDIITITNPEVGEIDQLVFANIFDLNMDGDIYTYKQYPYSSKLIYKFEKLTDEELSDVETFILSHTDEWIRLVDSTGVSRKVKIINRFIETTNEQGDLNTLTIEVQLYKDHYNYDNASINVNIQSNTNNPLLQIYTEFLPDILSETSTPILNITSLIEPDLISVTSDPNIYAKAEPSPDIITTTNAPQIQHWNKIDVVINSETTDDLQLIEADDLFVANTTIRLIVDASGEIDDSYATIQAAIDDSETLEISTIFIVNGTYQEEILIDQTAPLHIIGQSVDGVILNNNISKDLITIDQHLIEFSIRNLTIDTSDDTVNPVNAILQQRLTGIVVDKVRLLTIKNVKHIGYGHRLINLDLAYVYYVTIKDCSLTNSSIEIDNNVVESLEIYRNVINGGKIITTVMTDYYGANYRIYENDLNNGAIELGQGQIVENNRIINDTTYSYTPIVFKSKSEIINNTITVETNYGGSLIKSVGGINDWPSHMKIKSNILRITSSHATIAVTVIKFTPGDNVNSYIYYNEIESNTIFVNCTGSTSVYQAGIYLGFSVVPSPNAAWLFTKCCNNLITLTPSSTQSYGAYIGETIGSIAAQGNYIAHAVVNIDNDSNYASIGNTGEDGLNVLLPDGGITQGFLTMED